MPGPTGILDTLSDEQQEQLLTWLDLLPVKEVLEKVAAPPPEGFGIRTHVTSLRRFQQRAQLNFRPQDLALARGSKLTAEQRSELIDAASDALAQQSFQLATTRRLTSRTLGAVARWLACLQQHHLRERELALAGERLKLDHLKLKAALALKEAQSSTEYEESKIKSLRASIFDPAQPPTSSKIPSES